VKFLHTSDWHIGRQLHNHSLLDDQAHVLDQIVALAIDQKVDAVVIAGDVYDRSIPPVAAVALLNSVLDRLVNQANIPVLMIAGNHDSRERLGFGATQMASSGLHIEGPLHTEFKPVIINGVAFFLLPYAEPVLVRSVFGESANDVSTHQQAMEFLLEQVNKVELDSLPRVVVSHCFLAGGEESDSERPLSLGGADQISPSVFKEFSYTALGHLHGPQKKGGEHIRYSGSILKYSFSEVRQNKSVTLVDIDEQGAAQTELVALMPLRNLRVLEGALDSLLEQGVKDPHADDYLMIRLLDKDAILDVMGKLRSVYPNVLHLERTGLMAQRESLQLNREHLKQSELSMFKSFFEQVTGDELNDAQDQALSSVISSLYKGGDS
jgi:exonuclease SbcD